MKGANARGEHVAPGAAQKNRAVLVGVALENGDHIDEAIKRAEFQNCVKDLLRRGQSVRNVGGARGLRFYDCSDRTSTWRKAIDGSPAPPTNAPTL